MFSVEEKRKIAGEIEKLLLKLNHPEMPTGRPDFNLHVIGKDFRSWADIQPNWHYEKSDIKIPVEITFSIDPGQKETRWEPGFAPSVEDVCSNLDQVRNAVQEYLKEKGDLVEAELIYLARKINEEYLSDIKYQERRDR